MVGKLEKTNNYEYIDNEKINNMQDALSEKSNYIIKDKKTALEALSIIEKSIKEKLNNENIDIDLIYNKNEKKYYIVNINKASELGYTNYSNLTLEQISQISFNPMNSKTGEKDNIGPFNSSELTQISDNFKNPINHAKNYNSVIETIRNEIPEGYFKNIIKLRKDLEGSGKSEDYIFNQILSTKVMKNITKKLLELNKNGDNFYLNQSLLNSLNKDSIKYNLKVDDSYINDDVVLIYENIKKILGAESTEYTNRFFEKYVKYLNEKIKEINKNKI